MTYRVGSNQYKKTPQFDLASRLIMVGVAIYTASIIVGAKPVTAVDENTKFLQSIDFGIMPALTVEAEVRLPEKPDLTKPPKGMKTEIFEYLVEKFGDHAGDAITMIRKCENSSFNPMTINKSNNNGTWDVGVMQINVDPANTVEAEKLLDYKYNIDRGYAKWKQGDGGKHKNSFYLWTCGNVINQYTYVDRLNGR